MTEEMVESLVDGVVNKCIHLQSDGKGKEALQCIIEAEKKYKSKSITECKGMILNDLGRREEAIAVFDKLIQENPGEYSYFADKSLCLLMLGRTEDAIKNLRAALKLNPSSIDLTVFLGLLLNKTNEKEANELIKKATHMSAPRTFELMEEAIEAFIKMTNPNNEDRAKLKLALEDTRKEIQKLKDIRKAAMNKKKKK